MVKGVFRCFIALAAVLMMSVPAMAEDDAPTADLSVSFLSQYIWRGYELSQDSLVIQPSATFSYKGFSANIWSNLDTDPYDSAMENLNETDWTLSYDYSFDMVSGSVGYIYYDLDGADDSQELFVSATLDTLLSPTLTIYREFAHYPSTYVTLEISHSYEFDRGITLNMSLMGSALFSDDEDAYADPDDPKDKYSNFHDGKASVSLEIPATAFCSAKGAQYFTITPEINWVFPIGSDASDVMEEGSVDQDDDNFFYGGVTVSFSF